MASSDDVALPDLQVIQRYSLAVRGATARRAEVIAALQADLEWLTGGSRRRASLPEPPPAQPVEQPPVKKAPVRKAAKKAPVTKSGTRRG